MAKKLTKSKAALRDLLKNLMDAPVTPAMLDAIDENGVIKRKMKEKHQVPTVAELVVEKIVRLALDPVKAYQWAIELIWERMEGKPSLGIPVSDDGRVLDHKLDGLTTEQLNRIAGSFEADKPGRELGPDTAQERPAGPAAKLLEMQSDGTHRAQGPQVEPAVAKESA